MRGRCVRCVSQQRQQRRRRTARSLRVRTAMTGSRAVPTVAGTPAAARSHIVISPYHRGHRGAIHSECDCAPVRVTQSYSGQAAHVKSYKAKKRDGMHSCCVRHTPRAVRPSLFCPAVCRERPDSSELNSLSACTERNKD